MTDAFLERFREGFLAYQCGNWPAARMVLEECCRLRRTSAGEPQGDGPSSTLLEFMAKHGYAAPLEWPGYRELTEK